MASVKVAVRVRPFNKREENLSSSLIVEVRGNQVCLNPPGGGLNLSGVGMTTSTPSMDRPRPHKFTFDYAYWSHDPSDSHFADQSKIFGDLGASVVDNAFDGYNVCVFAYGQTGSGKTHTMMGTTTGGGDDPSAGLIPRICSSLFRKMAAANPGNFRTEVSYLEIYNESVRDLLSDGARKLKLREHPKTGPYVENLTKHLVVNYVEILTLMERGNRLRTTASTNMNDTSSRSHAIFTITFVSAGFTDGLPHETVSKIHLVDLAGSERADATGATGKRLKEGAHINKSLVTLGSVISALAEAADAKKPTFIPYRDSALTWLLKDSLGGNSKTFMIATVSPADVNHGETLSTLRYANRAKNIINKPTVNEDANVKLIRELRDEIDRLREMMSTDPSRKSELRLKEAQERHLTEEWTEKWKEAAKILKEQSALALKRTGWGVVLDSDKPHLVGIDEDVLSTGITLYHLKAGGETKIGGDPGSNIVLRGPNVMGEHCVIRLEEEGGVSRATLVPAEGAACIVNASSYSSPVRLSQGCVMIFGKTNMFRYNDPKEAAKMRLNLNVEQSNNNNRLLLSQSLSDLRAEDGSGRKAAAVAIAERCRKSATAEGLSAEASCSEASCSSSSGRSTSNSNADSSSADSVHEMTKLYDQINDQKEVVMSCLEEEGCDVATLEQQISLLQRMQNRYTKVELEHARQLWLSTRSADEMGDSGLSKGDEANESHFSRLVEQEVDRRLLQEKTLRSEAEVQERELLRMEKERELARMRREHEREIYLLRKKLHETEGRHHDDEDGDRPFDANVAIPSFVLSGSGSEQHVEYVLQVRTGGDSKRWQVRHRFRQFRILHVQMCQSYGHVVQSISFPSRRLFGSRSPHLAQERRQLLQRYLNNLVQSCGEIERCPLHNSPTKEAMIRFSPFFDDSGGGGGGDS